MQLRGGLRTARVVIFAALTALTSLLGLSACSGGDATGLQDNVLVGQWGSATVALIAVNAGADLADGCNTVVMDRPILLAEDGSFRISGRVHTGFGGGRGRATVLEGRVQGSTVTVTAELYATAGPTTLTLESGVAPSPDYNPQCPL